MSWAKYGSGDDGFTAITKSEIKSRTSAGI
jgi:hypothetical protein